MSEYGKYKTKIVISELRKSDDDIKLLFNLKNYLNNNINLTNLPDTVQILKIKDLHEIHLSNNRKKYGCMGDFKDEGSVHNRSGTFYGEGYGINEYTGSFDIGWNVINKFLRNYKIQKIIENGNK